VEASKSSTEAWINGDFVVYVELQPGIRMARLVGHELDATVQGDPGYDQIEQAAHGWVRLSNHQFVRLSRCTRVSIEQGNNGVETVMLYVGQNLIFSSYHPPVVQLVRPSLQ
jgi:hypothetical protein